MSSLSLGIPLRYLCWRFSCQSLSYLWSFSWIFWFCHKNRRLAAHSYCVSGWCAAPPSGRSMVRHPTAPPNDYTHTDNRRFWSEQFLYTGKSLKTEKYSSVLTHSPLQRWENYPIQGQRSHIQHTVTISLKSYIFVFKLSQKYLSIKIWELSCEQHTSAYRHDKSS